MPKFLSEDEVFLILHSELPEGVYAEDFAKSADPTKRSWSSSELRAWAKLTSIAYASLENIYEDKTATNASALGIERWEKDWFFYGGDATLTWEERRAALLVKIRSRGGLSYAAINAVVAAILERLGFTWDIVTLSGSLGGVWMVDTSSRLDVDTYLAPGDPLRGAVRGVALDCALDYAAVGITAEQLAGIQEAAYIYVVRILGDTLPEGVQNMLDLQLSLFEPARSMHIIVNNFSGDCPDIIDGGLFTTARYFGIIDGGRFGVASEYDVIDGGAF